MKMTCEKCGKEWDSEHAGECPFCYEITDSPKNPEMIMAKAYALKHERGIKAMLFKKNREIAELYATAANMGEPLAQYEYARCLEEGIGVKKSIENALVWYKNASRQGMSQAQYKLAMALLEKCADTSPTNIAYFWLRVSAELGNADAQHKLSHLYAEGVGTSPSPKHAVYWLAQSAENGSAEAACEIAQIFTEGKIIDSNYAVARWFLVKYEGVSKLAHSMLGRLGQGLAESPDNIIKIARADERYELGLRALKEKEYTIAYKLLYMSADEGYMLAYDRLAHCYINGLGVNIDISEGKRLLEYAHSRGCSSATLYLGDCYRDGIFERDYAKAMEYYRSAAENGNATAQYTLADAYFEGKITECNIPLASKWYGKAASQGYEGALVKMQKIHQYVESTFNRAIDAESVQDYKLAYELYSEASEFGHAGAMCNMGKLLQKGQGCDKDNRRAVAYYMEAVRAGSEIAHFNLGLCYLRGQGVSYSYDMAREHLMIASGFGIPSAKKLLDDMNARRERKRARALYSTACVIYKRGEIGKALQVIMYAARRGSARAMYIIGCHYEFGIEVEANKAMADDWYRKSAMAGFNTAKTNLKKAFLEDTVRRMRK